MAPLSSLGRGLMTLGLIVLASSVVLLAPVELGVHGVPVGMLLLLSGWGFTTLGRRPTRRQRLGAWLQALPDS